MLVKIIKSYSGRPIKREYDNDKEYYNHQKIHFDHPRKVVEDLKMDELKEISIEEFTNKVAGGRILDIGCRNGWLNDNLSKEDYEVYGVEMIKEFKPLMKDSSRVYFGDAHQLPYEDNFFDAVFARHSLEHMHTPTQVVKEINRILVPKGVLFAIVPLEKRLTATHAAYFSGSASFKECLISSMIVDSCFHAVNDERNASIVSGELWAWAHKRHIKK